VKHVNRVLVVKKFQARTRLGTHQAESDLVLRPKRLRVVTAIGSNMDRH